MNRVIGTRPTKSGGRPLAADTVRLIDGLGGILAEQAPLTVRGAYYQASTAGLVDKTEAGYRKVQRALVRSDGESVEVDAIPAPVLRNIVEEKITRHIDRHEMDVLLGVEQEERDGLRRLAGGMA